MSTQRELWIDLIWGWGGWGGEQKHSVLMEKVVKSLGRGVGGKTRWYWVLWGLLLSEIDWKCFIENSAPFLA